MMDVIYQIIKLDTSNLYSVYVNKPEENVVYSPKVFVGMQVCNALRTDTFTWQ